MAAAQSDHALKAAEAKRRRRELLAVGIASAILVAFVLAQTTLPPLSSHTSLVSNVVVILLFDFSFILMGLMLVLVGRNLAKAFFERRRGLIGSKLQARLVFGFSIVALVPSVFLLYVSGAFLHSDIDSWFRPEYEKVLDDSLEVAKVYYLHSANTAAHFARVLATGVSEKQLLEPQKRPELRRFLTEAQHQYGLGTIEVFAEHRRLVMLMLSAQTPTGIGVSPDSSIVSETLKGRAVTRTDRFGKSDVIRGSSPIFASPDSDTVVGAIVIDYYLPRSLADRAAGISRGVQEYFQLRILRQPIMHSYILALVLIGLAVVLLASWFGMYIARGITNPIKLLAEGTQLVASGNLNVSVPDIGDDEIGHLISSFNRMTADLRSSRAEIERRRRYTETLLRYVSAGVIGLDADHRLTAINRCAEQMLEVKAAQALGSSYETWLPASLARLLSDHLRAGPLNGETRFPLKLNQGTDLMVTLTPFEVESATGEDRNLGLVVFLEDVSQIAKIERMEAWREVARRVAHEIKNPLTPIQLSAERIRRHAGGDGVGGLIDECTRTIISEVEDLKRLVNEFAAFARMPQLNPAPADLNALVAEVVNQFRSAYPAVAITAHLESALPWVAFDREALKRALVNLLDNAIAAATGIAHNGEGPQVRITTTLNTASGVVIVAVEDNGPGIDPQLRKRLFEPYFSTKNNGTGLGLAIVASIVTDHRGFVRVYDRAPHGSRFVLEFPIKDQPIAHASA